MSSQATKPQRIVAGVDEAGRGPLAGPVVAAAVVLDARNTIAGLADSKKIPEKRRSALAEIIKERSACWAVGLATVEEIDRLNILHATMLAMQRAVAGLHTEPQVVLVDGNRAPNLPCPVETIIKGDATIPSISAASIIAKVTRDAIMLELDRQYPQYGFAIHKGYPTRAHLQALSTAGISAVHRKSFAPVKDAINVKKPTNTIS